MKKILLFLSFLLVNIGVFGETISLTQSQVTTFGSNMSPHSNSYSNDYDIDGWTGRYAIVKRNDPLTYSLQLGYNTSSSQGAYNSHITIPLLSGGATSITISTKKHVDADTKSGRTFYLCKSNDLGYVNDSHLPSSGTYGLGSITENNGSVTITIIGNPTQFHIYPNGTAYISSITVTYSSSTTKFSITYDTNGGSTVTDASSPYETGNSVTIKSGSTKNGYTFDSWNTKSDYSGVEFLGGESFTITKDTIFYAKWLKDTVLTDGCNIFHETWDSIIGTGGNDGSMSGNVGTSSIMSDNDGWLITKTDSTKNTAWGADRCIRIGIGTESGFAQSPVIQKGNQNEACLTFRAAGWGSDGTVLSLSVDNATLDISSITLTNSTWKTYTVYLTNITDDYTIIWSNSGGKKRFFLDDICITEVTDQLDIISWYNDSVIVSKNYFDSIPFNADNIRIDDLLTKTHLVENSNGEFKVPVDLHESYCSDKKFIVSDGKYALSQTIKIPTIVTSPTNTSDISDEDCDVVVQGTLTVTGTSSTNRDVKLYKGAHLSVPSGTTYTINSLALRRDNLTTSTLDLKGTLNTNKLYFDLYINAADWYFVCLPSSFTLTDLRYANGRTPLYKREYWIRWYDGLSRAVLQTSSWRNVDHDKEFNTGEGFIIYLTDDLKKKEFRFELPTSTLIDERSNKNVSDLHAWGAEYDELQPNHKGWNLIGNPFMNRIVTDLGDPISIGRLVKDTLSGQWNGSWIEDEEAVTKAWRYGVFPSKDPEDAIAGGYKSRLLDDITLEPFTSFFVQIDGDSTKDNQAILFNTPNPSLAPCRLVQAEDEELLLRFIVGNRNLGMFISNKFNDEYEPGDDLESNYPTYQLINGYRLLYSAISDSMMESGVRVIAENGRLKLDPKTDINKFDYIQVLYNNSWYDLKLNELDVEGEFVIYAKRKINNVATSTENIETDTGTYKIIKNNKLYIIKNRKVYSIFGTEIDN